MSEHNPWELYSSTPGWEMASQTLTIALGTVLTRLDRLVATGTPIPLAANAVFNDMVKIMSGTRMEKYGATDSEPRAYLASQIQKHIRVTHHVKYFVDRFGDVTEF
jgi:hypothetical protein